MQRAITWVIVSLCTILVTGIRPGESPGQEPAKDPASVTKEEETLQGETASVWMKRKLDISRNLLGGIASGDFDAIGKNARNMRTLSKLETFVRRSTPGYRTQVELFEHSLDEIIRNADKENLEGVTLGFNHLTNSCVSCHQRLRAKK